MVVPASTNSILQKDHADLLEQIQRDHQREPGSPTTSYSILNTRHDKSKEEESIKRSDVRGIDVEASPEIIGDKSIVSTSSVKQSREDKLKEMGHQIGDCFQANPKKEQVSPISNSIHASAEKVDDDSMMPELNVNDLDHEILVDDSKSSASDEPSSRNEIVVEEVSKMDESAYRPNTNQLEVTDPLADSTHQKYTTEDADWLADEILAMMIYSDVQENPTHPYRDKKMILNFRNKFPFNKPVGIDTRVDEFVGNLKSHILTNFDTELVQEMVQNLVEPVQIDPLHRL